MTIKEFKSVSYICDKCGKEVINEEDPSQLSPRYKLRLSPETRFSIERTVLKMRPSSYDLCPKCGEQVRGYLNEIIKKGE